METTVFECKNCGGNLEFEAGAGALTCPFCGTRNEPPTVEAPETYEELDFDSAVRDLSGAAETTQASNVKCGGCGAEVTITPPDQTASCAYCGTQVVATGSPETVLAPQYILPFAIPKNDAASKFREWIATRRFAPNKLKQYTRVSEPIKGIYYPFWTFDAASTSDYTGQRGEYYQEEVKTKDAEGKEVTTTVTKTRWYPASGTVARSFNDVLIPASDSLENEVVRRFTNFPLHKLLPYDPQYLSGYHGESYSIELKDGFDDAKEEMEQQIRSDVRSDIGGDTQRITSLRTRYDNVTFKYITLPIYALKYRFNKKIYPVVINGVTGEVQGKRPISWLKVAATVAIVAAVGVGIYFALRAFGVV